MLQEHTAQRTDPARQRPSGVRGAVYYSGRIIQGIGLLLIWWVLLLFTGAADMGTLLYWSFAAIVVFYLGWACATWARKSRPIHHSKGNST
jgi:hypothetical protein